MQVDNTSDDKPRDLAQKLQCQHQDRAGVKLKLPVRRRRCATKREIRGNTSERTNRGLPHGIGTKGPDAKSFIVTHENWQQWHKAKVRRKGV